MLKEFIGIYIIVTGGIIAFNKIKKRRRTMLNITDKVVKYKKINLSVNERCKTRNKR